MFYQFSSIGLLLCSAVISPNFHQVSANGKLCANIKENGTCACKTVPVNIFEEHADCSWTHLQKFPGLEEISFNRINVLNISYNDLEVLETVGNSTCENLRVLDLSYNKIHNIDNGFFEKFPNLMNLDLRYNQILELFQESGFSTLKNLQHFDLSFNKLENIPENLFIGLENLKFFDLSYNGNFNEELTQKGFHLKNLGLPRNLTTLKLNHLGIKELPNDFLSQFQKLIFLSLTDNSLSSFPNIPFSLEFLDLSGNMFEKIDPGSFDYKSLKIFKLNRLWQLKKIEPMAFASMELLEELWITDCHKLQEFPVNVFRVVEKNTDFRLRKLHLARNRLRKMNQKHEIIFKMLDFLDLRDNFWDCECDLLWFQNVSNIYKRENLRCSQPDILYQIAVDNLTSDELPGCFPKENENRTLQRVIRMFLVLLIVILLILFGYLVSIYYKDLPSSVGVVSPDSPYNPIRIQDY